VRFDRVLERLAAAGGHPLPGAEAQAVMAPRPRRSWVPGILPADAKRAAALALLYPANDDTVLVLTVRGAGLPHHRGQVSFPGGAVEPGESVEQSAFREAEEEIALQRHAATVRLALTPLHIPVSGFVLHPIVATAASRPTLAPSAREVASIVEPSLSALTADGAARIELSEHEGIEIEVPYFDLGGPKLWGATAMVVAELLAVLGTAPVRPGAQRLP